MRLLRRAVMVGVVLVAAAARPPLDAHKPITSPYTFAEDVLPILRERCATCHVAGGPAPMPLTTADETVPWGESIRLELIARHMPPWSAMSGGRRLRHAEGVTARELNVLLTWVTGGTPPGEKAPEAVSPPRAEWALGPPDVTLQLPEVTVAADQGEVTREFVLALEAGARRPLRAVDVRPGTRSLVRSARVFLRSAAAPAGEGSERMLALWVPGDTPVPLPAGAGFEVPANAELVAQVRYKKTWEHEREVMTDRSTLGLYFAADGETPVAAWEIAGAALESSSTLTDVAGGVKAGRSLTADTRAVAVYPTAAAAGATITVDVTPPDGRSQRVIEFTPQPGWERRYWLDGPMEWPRGSRLDVSVTFASRPPGPPPVGPLVVVNTISRR